MTKYKVEIQEKKKQTPNNSIVKLLRTKIKGKISKAIRWRTTSQAERTAPQPGMRPAAAVTGSLASAGFLIFVHMLRQQKNSCGLILVSLRLELLQD